MDEFHRVQEIRRYESRFGPVLDWDWRARLQREREEMEVRRLERVEREKREQAEEEKLQRRKQVAAALAALPADDLVSAAARIGAVLATAPRRRGVKALEGYLRTLTGIDSVSVTWDEIASSDGVLLSPTPEWVQRLLEMEAIEPGAFHPRKLP